MALKNIYNLCDAYKFSHPIQYPEGTTKVYSNWTIRGTYIPNLDYYIFYGLQYFIKEYLIDRWNTEFFNLPKEEVISKLKRRLINFFGKADVFHYEKLHELGYLPIEIKALPEGSKVSLRVPCVSIVNTLPEFYWVTNMLETIFSNTIWGAINSATISSLYTEIKDKYLKLTCDDYSLKDFLQHDFSYRGMFSNEAGIISGSAFLLFSNGTDTVPAVDFLENYYNADSDKEFIGGSVPASEHSVVCAGGDDNEEDTFLRLITKVYPDGIFSYVSDTWDYFNLINNIARKYKEVILKRNGTIVFRPDSSPKTPLEIICGDKSLEDKSSLEYKGSLEILWDIFGGNINSKGYKVINPKVKIIYGESISIPLYEKICETMKQMGFALSNLIVGIGSYSFQYNTRDTLKQACKATYVEINNVPKEIFKNPKTDKSGKQSAKGLLKVIKIGDKYELLDKVNKEDEMQSELKTVFKDGILIKETSLNEIRQLCRKNI